MLETVFTVFLILGVAAFTVWLFSRTLRTAVKFLFNGLCGVVFLFALHLLGLPLPLNLFTLIISMLTGGFGVILLLLYSVIF